MLWLIMGVGDSFVPSNMGQRDRGKTEKVVAHTRVVSADMDLRVEVCALATGVTVL